MRFLRWSLLVLAVLPAFFGGGPTDYQFLENETGAGSASEKMLERIWQDSEFVTVERAVPRVTQAGKAQHVHVERRPAVLRAGSAR
jgi:hypothetical protein